MLFDERKNYAREISMDFGIDYAKVLDMTLAEIEELSRKRFEVKLNTRMNNNSIKKLQLLMKDYNYYHEKFGDSLIQAFCYKSEDSYFEWSDKGNPWVDYSTDEAKAILTKNDSGWYSRNKLSIKRFSNIAEMFDNAIAIRFPELIKYCPQVHGYRSEWLDAEMGFAIITRLDEDGDKKQDMFYCTLGSFLEQDIDSMIEDHLDSTGFCCYESTDDSGYIRTNKFLSSDEIKKFFDVIKNLK